MTNMINCGLDPKFYLEFPHEIKIVSGVVNAYGEFVDSETTRIAKAYIEPIKSAIRGDQHNDYNRTTDIVTPDLNIKVTDWIILPDGSKRKIRSVSNYDYVPGLQHAVVVIE